MTSNRDTPDLLGGALMAAVGLFFALYGSQYTFGTAQRMGPGWFPVVLGWVLLVLGILIALPAWFRRGTKIEVQWSNLLWCTLGLIVFAMTLHWLGVVVASIFTALIALIPSPMPLRTRLTISVVVAIIVTLIFPIGLNMILPLWPWSL